MLRKANNVFSVLLENAVTSGVPTSGVITDANLPKGAIVAVDLGMNVLSSIPTNSDFMIVQGKGAGVPLMKSPILNAGRVSIKGQKYVAPVQQVTYVGYNPSLTTPAGALTAAANTDYWIKIRKRDNDAANRSQPMSLFAGPVKSGATAGDQISIANDLVKVGTKNFSLEPANGYLTLEVVSAGTRTAAGGAGNLTFTPGSKTVVASAATASNAIVVGDYIAAATGLTSGVYKVAAVAASGNLTLEVAFVGAAPVTVTGASLIRIAKSTAEGAAAGVRLTGVVAPFNVNSFRDYYANRFTVTYNDTTVPVKSTGANDGTGVWQKVAMDEYMSYGFEGQNNQMAVPALNRDQEVKTPASFAANLCTYSAINISWEETINGLVSRDGGKGSVLIYLNLSSAGLLATTGTSGETLANMLGAIASPTFTATSLNA